MRRQNRSCDQCRKAKRACDLYLRDPQHNVKRPNPSVGRVGNASLTENYLESLTDDNDTRVWPCSYCRRTQKQCTLNWVRSRLQHDSAGRVSGAASSGDAHSNVQRQSLHPQPRISNPPIAHGGDFGATGPSNIPWAPTSTPSQTPRGRIETNFANGLASPTSPTFASPSANVTTFEPPMYPYSQPTEIGTCLNTQPIPYQPLLTDCSSVTDMTTPDMYSQHSSSASEDEDTNELSSFQAQSHRTTAFQPFTPVSNSHKKEPPSASPVGLVSTDTGLISPFSTTHAMVMNANKRIISNNLISIYRNAFELALACCLSQEACPYQFNAISQPPTSGISWLSSRFENVRLINQYDPKKQASGVYFRVFKLDRVARANNLIRLTEAENRAASEALYLAIMAFAIQWAQGNQRGHEKYPHTWDSTDNTNPDPVGNLSDEFDRTLQKTLWFQAKRALQDCADIECFRVICAEWIMTLAQKPMEDVDFAFDIPESTFRSKTPIVGKMGTITSQISNIMEADGPPWFIERAARKIHTLKFRYDAHKASVVASLKGGSPRLMKIATVERISNEDMGTFNLMYWMTIMIDTISAVINNRPIVISDAECHHDSTYLGHPELEQFSIDHRPYDPEWWATVFSPAYDDRLLRWPCFYETAIKVIVAATPVKVVLFRHVSHLQNSIRSNFHGESIENILSNAMAIYKHWNVTYSAFFRDMIDQYHTVPMQMRIWFIHVVAYFHCAALVLADLIELVDEKGLGLEYPSQVRVRLGVVRCLRADSTTIISDLAQASECPPATDVPALNFDLVKRAILPEPWTMILIRAFTKVATIQLAEMEEASWNSPASLKTPSFVDLTRRCENCIKALYHLGSKSDMARAIGAVLLSALRPHLAEVPKLECYTAG
ncbi:hypothetical protein BGZ61DRAFT_348172 [Ilyonectria robusta]|uniref:uncharacterized protein n=1 Tax=Ilyonectria robusta TaxID=1079257 RepID=UPI001E8CE4DC|nr:uncharacterized protein BGZ61DRAFT_348172 [Ilyonectria robusta]KAH8721644.1 hypothetical protein BGZ61DRAFT_348172 [Ilyonectria robusta]